MKCLRPRRRDHSDLYDSILVPGTRDDGSPISRGAVRCRWCLEVSLMRDTADFYSTKHAPSCRVAALTERHAREGLVYEVVASFAALMDDLEAADNRPPM